MKGFDLVEKRWSQYVFLFAVLILFPVMILLSAASSPTVFQKNTAPEITSLTDYTHETVHDPAVKSELTEIYRLRLPRNLAGGECLALYSKYSDIHITAGQTLLYSYEHDPDSRWHVGGGSTWNLCRLSGDLAGKELEVRISPNYASQVGKERVFLLGDYGAILKAQLLEELPMLLASLIVLAYGISFILRDIRDLYYDREWDVIWLGFFLLLVGAWKLTDLRVLSLLWQEASPAFNLINLCALMFLPYPVMMWLYYRTVSRKKLLHVMALVSLALMLLVTIMQFLGVVDIRENNALIFANVLACAVSILVASVWSFVEHRKGKVDTFQWLDYAFAMALCAGGAGDIFFYSRNGGRSEKVFITIFITAGFAILEGMAYVWRQTRSRQKLQEMEKEMSRAHEAVMISQIQPHFLYNALNTIYYLCEMDAKVAQKAVQDFSSYLRGNLEALEKKEPVPVEDELAHTRHYLDLEKMRFGDELEIVYHMEYTDFVVPALTIQPIVENAVKYGWTGMKEDVKKIYIHTYKDENYYYIVVRDNGAGFDTTAVNDDGRKHVGITNVRSRLESLCRGELEIKSYPGAGTTATIKIPKEGTGKFL